MESAIVALFALTSFLASALLFLVEPMIGKTVLPVFGGTPAVWNACLVFFQGTLLIGYLLAHGFGRAGWTERRLISGVVLFAIASLLAASYLMQPIALAHRARQPFSVDRDPLLDLLGVLCRSATLPLVMVSATAPLLQGWFATIDHRRSSDPYFLYAASNAGSLLALLCYPFVIEPNLGLIIQSVLWKSAFLILAVLVMACGLVAWRLGQPRSAHKGAAGDSSSEVVSPTLATSAMWIALVFIPSSWLMGVTAYLTTDLTPVPLIWIIPLSLYLLSFVLAFSSSTARLVRGANVLLPYLIVPLVLVMFAGFVNLFWVPLHLAVFFVGALVCHGALARMRPAARNLSVFYITIALGGLLGGMWNTLAAPFLFNRVAEYPLALLLACVIAPLSRTHSDRLVSNRWSHDLLFAAVVFCLTIILATNQAGLADSVLGAIGVMIASGLGLLACLTAQRRPIRFAMVIGGVMLAGALTPGVSGNLMHVERNFFGVLRVTYFEERAVMRLFHGSTLHGEQNVERELASEPLTYFTRSGPIGQLFRAIDGRVSLPGSRIAIVGLGVGTLASYAQPGQHWTFYEIDGAVARIAQHPRFFTYLRDCRIRSEAVEVILGDARQRLEGAPDGAYQLIVLDAFSSDALPVHLLSREAIRLYRSKLAAGGLLVFNLTNRYLDLDPVIGRQASDAGLVCRVSHDVAVSDEEKRAGKQPSIWAVLAVNETDLGSLASDRRWYVPALRPKSAVWTDDYSDLAAYLLFTQRRR